MAFKRLTALLFLSLALLTAAFTSPAQAQMTLTPAAVSAGYKLTTFATGFPNAYNQGPYGIAVLGTGNVLVTDGPGNVRQFPNDTDGQNAASISPAQNFGQFNAFGLASVNGIVYMGTARNIVQLNLNGTYNSTVANAAGVGLVANPRNGHLFSSTGSLGSSVYDIDPATGNFSTFVSGYDPDGLAFNANGSVLYVADVTTSHVLGYDSTTKSQIFDSGYIPGGPDGIAIGSGSISGNLFINTNSGNLYEINLASGVQTLIASGGSRGDFVTPDPNGTLLLTQTDRILRLTAPPPGGGFSPDGKLPIAGLIKGTDGSFYGTTRLGGAFNYGTLYKTDASGTVSVLYSFSNLDSSGNNLNGAYPVSNLVQGSDGLFYGATSKGGSSGSGTVFKVTRAGAFTLLHSFTALNSSGQNMDGAIPKALVQGNDGAFYGVAQNGGSGGSGTVYKITSAGVFTLLYSFTINDVNNVDGSLPYAGLVQGNDGAFYGTASQGGVYSLGTIFKITASGVLTTLYTFGTLGTPGTSDSFDGALPQAALVQGNDGAFYGTAGQGGVNYSGTVFKVTPSGTFTLLYSFSQLNDPYKHTNIDGNYPVGALIQSSDGAFYGTALRGGTSGVGTVFKLSASGAFTTLYSFSTSNSNGSPNQGNRPTAGLLQDSSGLFYGTASYGGTSGGGVLFSIDAAGNYTTIHNFTGN